MRKLRNYVYVTSPEIRTCNFHQSQKKPQWRSEENLKIGGKYLRFISIFLF